VLNKLKALHRPQPHHNHNEDEESNSLLLLVAWLCTLGLWNEHQRLCWVLLVLAIGEQRLQALASPLAVAREPLLAE